MFDSDSASHFKKPLIFGSAAFFLVFGFGGVAELAE